MVQVMQIRVIYSKISFSSFGFMSEIKSEFLGWILKESFWRNQNVGIVVVAMALAVYVLPTVCIILMQQIMDSFFKFPWNGSAYAKYAWIYSTFLFVVFDSWLKLNLNFMADFSGNLWWNRNVVAAVAVVVAGGVAAVVVVVDVVACVVGEPSMRQDPGNIFTSVQLSPECHVDEDLEK